MQKTIKLQLNTTSKEQERAAQLLEEHIQYVKRQVLELFSGGV